MRDKAAWTVMVYLAGDNNLTDASVFAMTEIKKVTPGPGINIVTQFDPSDDYLPTHRYHIWRKDEPGRMGPLSHDIIDTSEKGGFEKESDFARAHDRVLSAAREKGQQAAITEAERLVPEEINKIVAQLSRAAAAQGAAPVKPKMDPQFLEPEDRPLRSNETDTGSPITLYNFMSLCVQHFPADHYIVILCGHGSGTAMDFLLKDDSPAGSLTITELKRAFQQLSAELNGQPIDILGMDTCLMGMGEVAYELRGLVKTMVSSESYSPVSGWPYQQIMGQLKEEVANSLKDPKLEEGIERRLAISMVEEYVNFYADYSLGGLSVDQSALNIVEAETLRVLVDSFAEALTTELAKDEREFKDDIIMAHWEAQSYNGEQFIDLVDFCNCLLKRRDTGPIFESGSKLKQFILDHFVIKSCYSGPAYQYSYGVSIYFPWARVDHEYQNLDFVDESGKTGWGKFLNAYTNLTRREPRPTSETKVFFEKNRRIEPRRYRQTQGKGPEGQNLIHSMRNPPVYAEPPACIRARDDIRRGLMSLLRIQPGTDDG